MFMSFAWITQETASTNWKLPYSTSDCHMLLPCLNWDITFDFHLFLTFQFKLWGSYHRDNSNFNWKIYFHVIHHQNFSNFQWKCKLRNHELSTTYKIKFYVANICQCFFWSEYWFWTSLIRTRDLIGCSWF